MLGFHLDRAVATFGRKVDEELRAVDNNDKLKPTGKSMRKAMILRKYTGIQQFAKPPVSRG